MKNLFIKLAYTDVDSRITFRLVDQDTETGRQYTKLELHCLDLEDFNNLVKLLNQPDKLDDQFVVLREEMMFVSLACFPPETGPDELSDEELASVTKAIEIATVILGSTLKKEQANENN